MKISIGGMGKDQDKYLMSLEKGQEVWLTEKKLGKILHELFPNDFIMCNERIDFGDDNVFKPDYIIANKRMIVEFQGPRHFTDSVIISRDNWKRNISLYHGYHFIEIPYFVQLTPRVINFLFNKNAVADLLPNKLENIQDFSGGFPHGFIHPKAILLGNFTLFGVQKAKFILDHFPKEVEAGCFKSLEKRSKLDGTNCFIVNPMLCSDAISTHTAPGLDFEGRGVLECGLRLTNIQIASYLGLDIKEAEEADRLKKLEKTYFITYTDEGIDSCVGCDDFIAISEQDAIDKFKHYHGDDHDDENDNDNNLEIIKVSTESIDQKLVEALNANSEVVGAGLFEDRDVLGDKIFELNDLIKNIIFKQPTGKE